jgi:hypothetical protein
MTTDITHATPAAIARIQTPAEAATLSRMADAASVFYKAKGDLVASQDAKAISLRSARRAGELLLPENAPRENGGRPKKSLQQKSIYVECTSYQKATEDAGITPFIAHTWQKLAQIPDDKFEMYLVEAKFQHTEYTVNGLLSYAHGKRVKNFTLDSAMKVFLHWLNFILSEWPDEAPELLRAVIEREL